MSLIYALRACIAVAARFKRKTVGIADRSGGKLYGDPVPTPVKLYAANFPPERFLFMEKNHVYHR
jgi:hypothetical protein